MHGRRQAARHLLKNQWTDDVLVRHPAGEPDGPFGRAYSNPAGDISMVLTQSAADKTRVRLVQDERFLGAPRGGETSMR